MLIQSTYAILYFYLTTVLSVFRSAFLRIPCSLLPLKLTKSNQIKNGNSYKVPNFIQLDMLNVTPLHAWRFTSRLFFYCRSAIEEGKSIFYNIRNFVRFQLST